jgi:beta-lactamase regulating signal transducer with metallopeptidase domain
MAFVPDCAHNTCGRIVESVREEIMALVHHHEPDRSRDLALCGLVLVVAAIIAAAIPVLKLCVDGCFGLFQ